MRRRLTAAFVLLTLSVLVVFVAVRASEIRSLVHERESVHLVHDAHLIASFTNTWVASGQPLRAHLVQGLLSADQAAQVVDTGKVTVHAQGASYGSGSDSDGHLVAQAEDGPITVTLSQRSGVIRQAFVGTTRSLFVLLFLLAVIAGIVGYLAARVLAAPFDRLAVAAGALGRGRSDLDLPRFRIPEAEAIAQALRESAGRVARSLHEDRAYLQHASHVLRTPLTGLRLELEELALEPTLAPAVRDGLARSIVQLDEVQTEAAGIVEMARRRSQVAGTEESLADVAARIAQSWDDALAGVPLDLKTTVDGDVALAVVPGPVEQVLDGVLPVLVRRATGTVLLNFRGSGDQIAITVAATGERPGATAEPDSFASVLTLVEDFGGRVTGDPLTAGRMRIWLPRR